MDDMFTKFEAELSEPPVSVAPTVPAGAAVPPADDASAATHTLAGRMDDMFTKFEAELGTLDAAGKAETGQQQQQAGSRSQTG